MEPETTNKSEICPAFDATMRFAAVDAGNGAALIRLEPTIVLLLWLDRDAKANVYADIPLFIHNEQTLSTQVCFFLFWLSILLFSRVACHCANATE
jgi:hypothetical protein